MKVFIERFIKVLWYNISLIVRCFTKVRSNRILCWSYFGKKYSCNPYYITKFLLENYPREYEIYWAFNKGVDTSGVPKNIKVIYKRTFKYVFIVNTSKFLITNCRTNKFEFSWKKKSEQKYIMTWHSSMGLKKVEKDAIYDLGDSYIKTAKYDSSICDLILSGCKYRTSIIRNAFWYNGEVLEAGTPRNDILFDDDKIKYFKDFISKQYSFDTSKKILLYAPTFRRNNNIDCYRLNWNNIVKALKEKTGDDYIVLLRLHPNLIESGIDFTSLFGYINVYDVTMYHDMQELLCITDILVTDYSSSIFDFSLLYRPCFIYAPDFDTYTRGTYFKLTDLPFPYSETEETLLKNILEFNQMRYNLVLKDFLLNRIVSYEDGFACQSFYNWMKGC